MNRLTEYKPRKYSMFPYQLKDDELSTKLDSIHKLGQIEDLMEKYNINDLVELEIALDEYDHRYDDVQTRRVDENETHKYLVDILGFSREMSPTLRKIVTLLMAYKQGYVYTKNIKDELVKEEILSQVGLTTDGEWCVVTRKGFILDKDYGKTWWLVNDKESE